MTPRLPLPVWAAMRFLQFPARPEETVAAAQLHLSEWKRLLDFADLTQLTLVLRARLVETGAWDQIPDDIRRRLDQNLADNTERWQRTQAALAEIADRFAAAGVDFLVLKGLSHSSPFVANPRHRVQYDIDFFFPGDAVYLARDILLDMGYEALAGYDDFPIDHLPTMLRKSGWRWRGNFFDPEIPPAVDLHFRLWDPRTEQLEAPGIEHFWNRRVEQRLAERRLWQFDLADQMGYATLHALRHLLRGSLRVYHIYELAFFLENRKADGEFWTRWRNLHPPALRRLESTALRLAEHWFGTSAAPAFGPAHPVPEEVERWTACYGWSPVEALFRPNKHELFLHLSLLDGSANRWSVLRRRLAPFSLPAPVDVVQAPKEQITLRLRALKWIRYFAFLGSRLVHHTRVLLPTLWGLARWQAGSRQ
ncbi:MAG: nucleotidyltransferase family protein [Acidobacteria bacterium]|nr:nucleotidyltransferase family protein [Acidobacteriota bacterium]